MDLNGDGQIGPYEGCLAVNPPQVALRDCLRQTALDLTELVRTIQGGLDLKGDGQPDLDATKIYYVGESLGSMYGTIFSALEPAVRASVLNVGGGYGGGYRPLEPVRTIAWRRHCWPRTSLRC